MTTIVVTNMASTQASPSLVFFQDVGRGATQPWSLGFSEMSSAQAQTLTIPPGSTLFLHTLGSAPATAVGWGMLSGGGQCGNGAVSVYAVFTQRVPGRPDQDGTGEATIPAHRFLVPFDNTNGAVTSMAIASAGSLQTISLGVRTSDGTVTQLPAIALPPDGHTSFAFPTQFPNTSGKAGLAEFYSSSDTFSILALRFGADAFTSTPVYSVTGAPSIVSTP